MKFYFAQFKHKRTNKSLYKFGITKHMDALKRFSVSESKRYGNSPKQYADFNIKILATIPFKSGQEAHALEKKFLEHFKDKPNLEYYFKESKGKYAKMSGVTELRKLTYQQLQTAFDMINEATPTIVKRRKEIARKFHETASNKPRNKKYEN